MRIPRNLLSGVAGTVDQDLLSLFRRELITTAEALRHASNPENLAMTLRGIAGSGSIQEARHDRGHDADRERPAPAPERPPPQSKIRHSP